MLKLSIIVPCFNSIEFIDETVQSILDQKLNPAEFEVVFIDGNSTDGTFEYIQWKQKELPDMQLSVYQSPPKGIYNACNEWVKHAKAEYILILMSDDCLYPNALSDYLQDIEKHPWLDLYYAEYDFFNKEGPIAWQFMPFRKMYRNGLNSFLMGFLLYITFPTAIYRKSLHETYGYFDESYKISGDWDFFIKLSKAKIVTSLFFPRRIVRFRIHPGSTSTGGKFIETAKSERDRIWKKHYASLRLIYSSVYGMYQFMQSISLHMKSLNSLPAPVLRVIHLLQFLYGTILGKSTFYKNVHKWFLVDGNKKYLLNYPLNKDSCIFEVGGYTWVFTDEAIQKFDCSFYIFEPIQQYYDILVEKYKDNKKVKVFQFWLWNKNTKLEMWLSNDGTSAFKAGVTETVEIKQFSQFIEENWIKNIDLISINIEGGEYDLIEDMVSSNAVSMMHYIQVQFHDFVENAESLRNDRVAKILNTHNRMYSFPFVWEAFELKK